MPFRAARAADVAALTEYINAASTPQVLEWTHSATYRNSGEWLLNGKVATLSGVPSGDGYNIVTAGIPFPTRPGEHRATVVLTGS